MSKKSSHIIFLVILLILALIYFYELFNMGLTEEDYFIYAAIIILGLLIFVEILRNILSKNIEDNEPFIKSSIKELMLLILCTTIYIVSIPLIGFFVSSFIFLIIACLIIEFKNLKIAFLFSSILVFIVFTAFKVVMGIRFPTGILL